MTDPLIEQIKALVGPETDESDMGYNRGLKHAADLVAAWLSSNPVGAVVKPLVWHSFDAWTYWAESTSGTYRVEERNGVWRATLNLPQTEHLIYEYTTDDLTHNDYEAAQRAAQDDHNRRILSALSSTPVAASIPPETGSKTPALDALAMKRAAMDIRVIGTVGMVELGPSAKAAIAAITLPPGAALAEALRLPEIAAAMALLTRAKEELRMIRMKDTGAVYDVMLRTEIDAALAALGEQP